MKKGFNCIPSLQPQLNSLSYIDLQLLFTGASHFISCLTSKGMDFISVETLKSCIRFRDFPQGSKIPSQFIQLLDEFSQNDLRRFLLFVTALDNIPTTGNLYVSPNHSS